MRSEFDRAGDLVRSLVDEPECAGRISDDEFPTRCIVANIIGVITKHQTGYRLVGFRIKGSYGSIVAICNHNLVKLGNVDDA